MDKSKVKARYNKALELKGREQYIKTLKDELTKPEWLEKLATITSRMDSISSVSDYENTMQLLLGLFDEVYQKIAAPGLDKFIDWVEENSKNKTNRNKLRDFLMKDYEKYSSKIDDILAAVEALPDENEKHLFDKLISDFKSRQKSIITKFINDSSSYANNIDDFLNDLKIEYEGLSNLAELSYKSVEELYNDKQKTDSTLSFYISIIENAISEGQSLKEQNEQEKNQKLWKRAQNRIISIKKCITLLQQTGIAKNIDEELKSLFTRFNGEMLKTKGDIAQVLSEYIENIWNPLQDKYLVIKAFYEEDDLVFDAKDWEDYEKKNDLEILVLTYKKTRSGNILPTIKSVKLDNVITTINKCHKSIVDLRDLEDETRLTIKLHIEEFYKQYLEKRQMLEKLVDKKPELKIKFDDIYSEKSQGKFLPNIHNGIESLKNEGTLLTAMSKDDATIYETLKDMKKTKSTFMEILKQSQMEAQIKWINDFGENTIIDSKSFNAEYLLALLNNGLITLSFEKTF